ncbi:MAG TPA: hypothetical protein VJH34_02535 [archaeon]|nr:hypothetical protein [archaeon]
MEVGKIAAKKNNPIKANFNAEDLKKLATEIQDKLLNNFEDTKKYLTQSFKHLRVDIKDSKFGVEVLNGKEITIDMGLKVSLKTG